eukprot:1106688-Prymnesium_polylepis.1
MSPPPRPVLRIQGGRSAGEGEVDPTTICRHLLRGNCLYGADCAFLHVEPDPLAALGDERAAELAECDAEYRRVETGLNALRRDGGSRAELAALAVRLRDLQALRRSLAPAVRPKPVRKKL